MHFCRLARPRRLWRPCVCGQQSRLQPGQRAGKPCEPRSMAVFYHIQWTPNAVWSTHVEFQTLVQEDSRAVLSMSFVVHSMDGTSIRKHVVVWAGAGHPFSSSAERNSDPTDDLPYSHTDTIPAALKPLCDERVGQHLEQRVHSSPTARCTVQRRMAVRHTNNRWIYCTFHRLP